MDGRMRDRREQVSEELPDIILVVLDAARWDRFGCYGSTRGATPTVDGLARESRVVETMIANGPWTLPSHGSLFTGLYPSQHGSQWQTGPRLRDAVQVTMAEWLRTVGYQTVCATGNNLISSDTGLARGFRDHVSKKTLRAGRRWATRRARSMLVGGDFGGRMLNGWLRERLPRMDGPLFLFVNYLECHWPYVPPRRFERQVAGPRFGLAEGIRFRTGLGRRSGPWEAIARADEQTTEILSTLYDAELANADAHVAELLDVLERAGRLRDGTTLVIVTSDHGEHLGEHGLADHQASVDDHLVRVPFVIWGPGRIAPERRPELYEFVDVFPSVARLLDRDPPGSYLEQRRSGLFSDGVATSDEGVAFGEWRSWAEPDLTRLSAKNPLFDFSGLRRDLVFVRDRRFKLVRAGGRSERLYDLEGDPMEENDVSADHPEVVQRLRQELDRAVDSWRSWGDAADALTAQEAEEIEEHLSALGYI
jgi:arylsulfatase A-like enzyme